MKGVRCQRGKYWSAYVCRGGVRRSVACASEAEAAAMAEELREMPIEDFLNGHEAAAKARGVSLNQGKYWQAQVCRGGIRRVVSCPSEEAALLKVQELRAMPFEDFRKEYELTVETRGVALKQGKYWQAQVCRGGIRRAVNCASEKAALAKVRELRTMPIDEFRTLTINRKTDPSQLR